MQEEEEIDVSGMWIGMLSRVDEEPNPKKTATKYTFLDGTHD